MVVIYNDYLHLIPADSFMRLPVQAMNKHSFFLATDAGNLIVIDPLAMLVFVVNVVFCSIVSATKMLTV